MVYWLRRAGGQRFQSFRQAVFQSAQALDHAALIGVDYVIELNGGVSEAHLSQNISRWADVISAFVSKFQDGEPTS